MTTAQLRAALVAKGPITVALTNPHDPGAFYQTRAGLYVHRDFRDRIVRQARPTQSASPVTLKRFVLDRDALDRDIEAELGPNHLHLFTTSELCWIVAEMIGKQEDGTAGDLDNTGKANLFYTPSWVVSVYWSARGREWHVRTWGLDVYHAWDAGDSAFSRN
jgi:hypothetical protein